MPGRSRVIAPPWGELLHKLMAYMVVTIQARSAVPGLPSFPLHFHSLRVPTLLVTPLTKSLYFYVRCVGSPYTFIILGIILHAPGYLEFAL